MSNRVEPQCHICAVEKYHGGPSGKPNKKPSGASNWSPKPSGQGKPNQGGCKIQLSDILSSVRDALSAFAAPPNQPNKKPDQGNKKPEQPNKKPEQRP